MAKKSKNLTVVISVAILVALVTGIGVYFSQSVKMSELEKQISILKEEKSQDTETSKATSSKEDLKKSDTKDKKANEEEPGTKKTKEFGYIKKVYSKSGKNYLTIDYAQMLSGNDADKAAVADGVIKSGEHVDNDYYIRNTNPKLRTFVISSEAKITRKTAIATGDLKPKTVSFSEFRSIYTKKDTSEDYIASVPYWIEIQGSTITSIEEQYIP